MVKDGRNKILTDDGSDKLEDEDDNVLGLSSFDKRCDDIEENNFGNLQRIII